MIDSTICRQRERSSKMWSCLAYEETIICESIRVCVRECASSSTLALRHPPLLTPNPSLAIIIYYPIGN